jgi:hypothetical protein
LWVPATLRTSCDLLIFVDQAAEAVASYNPVKSVGACSGRGRRGQAITSSWSRLHLLAAAGVGHADDLHVSTSGWVWRLLDLSGVDVLPAGAGMSTTGE